MPRLAILIDGEFMKKRLGRTLRRFPTIADFRVERQEILDAYAASPLQPDSDLYRIFYYTAEPYTGEQTNPLNGSVIQYGDTSSYRRNRSFIEKLEHENDVAVRRGELKFKGWKLRSSTTNRLISPPTSSGTVVASDLQPNFKQKGVDMRIGLDIATLALKRLVTDVVVVTGDLDMIPALKLARREGLRVYLHMMGARGRPQLRAHADQVIG